MIESWIMYISQVF